LEGLCLDKCKPGFIYGPLVARLQVRIGSRCQKWALQVTLLREASRAKTVRFFMSTHRYVKSQSCRIGRNFTSATRLVNHGRRLARLALMNKRADSSKLPTVCTLTGQPGLVQYSHSVVDEDGVDTGREWREAERRVLCDSPSHVRAPVVSLQLRRFTRAGGQHGTREMKTLVIWMMCDSGRGVVGMPGLESR